MHVILCYEKFIRKKVLEEDKVRDVSQRNIPRDLGIRALGSGRS